MRPKRRAVVIDEIVEERNGYTIRKTKRYKEALRYRIYSGSCLIGTPAFSILGSAQDWCDAQRGAQL